jgi:hypothetical protein
MTRKEQIIEIITNMVLPDWNISPKNKYYTLPGREIPKIADAILSLPIDVPSEEEIKSYVQSQCRYGYSSQEAISIVCVKWAIEQTIKRNGKDKL